MTYYYVKVSMLLKVVIVRVACSHADFAGLIRSAKIIIVYSSYKLYVVHVAMYLPPVLTVTLQVSCPSFSELASHKFGFNR